MKNDKWLKSRLIVGLTMGVGVVAAQAQPGGNAPLASNPPNQQQGGGRGNRPNFANMTPAQRQQMMQQQREQGVKMMLQRGNVDDVVAQGAIIAFINAQDAATQTLQDAARKVNQAVRNPDSTDDQIATALADLRKLAAAEKLRRATALTQMDAAINYTKNPRLDAILTLGGVIGDEAALLGAGGGGGGGGGRGGRGGMGGPGGGFGGGPGGGGFGGGPRGGGPGGPPPDGGPDGPPPGA